jgi:hypothetical protein
MAYTPQRGDIVWISFNPQAGHEQAGRRPGLVLSPAAYNDKVVAGHPVPDHQPGERLSLRSLDPGGWKSVGQFYPTR